MFFELSRHKNSTFKSANLHINNKFAIQLTIVNKLL